MSSSTSAPLEAPSSVRRRLSGLSPWWRDVVAAAAVGLAAMGLVLWHLFVPFVIGTSDTGDGLRLLCQIQAGDPHFYEGKNSSERFVAITLRPIPPNPKHCGKYRVTERYPSSAVAVLAVAQDITHLRRPDIALDMRVTGVLYSGLYGAAIALFVLVLPGRRWVRMVVAGAIGVIGSDATFVPYFISAFSEPLEFIALLATYATLIALWRRETVPAWGVAAATFVFGVLVSSKSQETPLALLLALALLFLRVPVGRLTGKVGVRVVPAIAAVVVLGIGSTVVYLQPRLYNQQLIYTDVFSTILHDSPDPVADLKELGLPVGLNRYTSRTYFQARKDFATDPEYAYFKEKITFTDIALFYARHPQRLQKVTGTALRNVVKARHRLPNTTRKDTAKPQVLCRICFVNEFGEWMKPKGVVVWPVWELIVLGVGVLLVRNNSRRSTRTARSLRGRRDWWALGLVLICTVGFAVFHVATAVLGDGYAELGKHVFPAVVDFWTVVPLVALGVAGLLPTRISDRLRRRPRPVQVS